ncbi:MAG: Penicillin-binding protein 4* [Fimbriimonadaceae bacterium]|nr:Penicillin-binding protein 4* [Fimbriimonadaceae bacterium]
MVIGDRVRRGLAAVDDYLRVHKFSGAIRIASHEGLLLDHASGLANRADSVPNQIDTRFGTASWTKSFTAAAIGRLVERGRTSFATKVVDLLPEERRPATLSRDVTLHHLLTHTSGIADYYDEVALGPAAFEDIWREHPAYLFRKPADFLPLFAHLPPRAQPGGIEGSYCSAGFILLGLIVEELSEGDYADFVERDIFRPAGMTDSGFLAMDEVHERVAIGYIEDERGTRTNHYAIPAVGGPDGGAFTTVQDLAKFLYALENGTFFGPGVLAAMRTPHVRVEGVPYGYGLWLHESGLGQSFGGVGADPGYSARAFRYPEAGISLMMLGNTIDATDGVFGAWLDAVTI